MFRRRRRDDADSPAPAGSEDEYLADEELGQDEDYDEDEDEDYDEDEDEDYEEDEELEDEDDEDFRDDEQEPGEGGPAEYAEAAGARRRERRTDRPDLSDPSTWTKMRDTAAAEPVHTRSEGPWDSAAEFPGAERVDLGCLLVPISDGTDVQIGFAPEMGYSIAVVAGQSALQLQPFAAPRTSGLWQEVRPEIAREVAEAGGRSQEQEGPFGPELLAWVTPPPMPGQPQLGEQPLRFLGADGPRWFLRGLISGPAATDKELAKPLEDAFSNVVVVRGDHAVPPQQPLQIQVPTEAQEMFEEQQKQAQEQGLPTNPFERGPEITETR
jgi:hypothetical protein